MRKVNDMRKISQDDFNTEALIIKTNQNIS